MISRLCLAELSTDGFRYRKGNKTETSNAIRYVNRARAIAKRNLIWELQSRHVFVCRPQLTLFCLTQALFYHRNLTVFSASSRLFVSFMTILLSLWVGKKVARNKKLEIDICLIPRADYSIRTWIWTIQGSSELKKVSSTECHSRSKTDPAPSWKALNVITVIRQMKTSHRRGPFHYVITGSTGKSDKILLRRSIDVVDSRRRRTFENLENHG